MAHEAGIGTAGGPHVCVLMQVLDCCQTNMHVTFESAKASSRAGWLQQDNLQMTTEFGTDKYADTGMDPHRIRWNMLISSMSLLACWL